MDFKDHPLSFRGFMRRTVYDKVRGTLCAGRSEYFGSNHPEYISELIEKLEALISVSVELELMVM